jgi:hypothetical protein
MVLAAEVTARPRLRTFALRKQSGTIQRYLVLADKLVGDYLREWEVTQSEGVRMDRLTLLNSLVFTVQWAVAEICCPGKAVTTEDSGQRRAFKQPELPRKIRAVQRKLEQCRADLGRFISLITSGATRVPLNKKWQKLKRRYDGIHNPENWEKYSVKLRDSIARDTAVIRKAKRRISWAKDTAGLSLGPKQYLSRTLQPMEPPTLEQQSEVEGAFRSIWSAETSQEVEEIQEAEWYSEALPAGVNQQAEFSITAEQLGDALRPMKPWKAPGRDGLLAYFLKKLPATHTRLMQEYASIVEGAEIPKWMTQGRAVLIPKNSDRNICEPGNSRPINCLSCMYKLFTRIVEKSMRVHIEPLLTTEQQGSRRETFGTVNQLLVDRIVTEEVVRTNGDMAVAWLDIAKAFDSLDHRWILHWLHQYKVDRKIIRLLERLMGQWESILVIGGSEFSTPIRITRGIFQGDSLSPLLFLIGMNPISTALAKRPEGIKVGAKNLNHLLYVDDYKIYSKSLSELDSLVEAISVISARAGLKLNEVKCQLAVVLKGKLVSPQREEAETATIDFKIADPKLQPAKYLGLVGAAIQIDRLNKKRTITETFARVKKVMRLNAPTQLIISALNSYAFGFAKYTLGVVDWGKTGLSDLDQKVRHLLATRSFRACRGGLGYLYLPRKLGGRGLLRLEDACETAVVRLYQYMQSHLSWLIEDLPNSITIQRLQTQTASITERLGATTVWEVKKAQIAQRLAEVTGKHLQGAFERSLTAGGDFVATKASRNWVKSEYLSVGTERLLFEIRDQTTPLRGIKAKIWKLPGPAVCRKCGKEDESVDHVLSGCSSMYFGEYLMRHNAVAKCVLQHILAKFGIRWNRQWWLGDKGMPKQFILTGQSGKGYVRWAPKVKTTEKVPKDTPDLLVKLPDGRKFIMEFTVCSDSLVTRRHQEKLEGYQALADNLQLQSKRRPNILVFAIGCTGAVTRGTEEAVRQLNAAGFSIRISQLQRVAAIGSVRIIRNVLASGDHHSE